MAQIRHARLRHSAHDSGERPRAVARDIFEQRKFAEVKTLEFAHAYSVPLGNGRQAELWRGRIRRHHTESAARADAFGKAGYSIPLLRDGFQCGTILQAIPELTDAELPLERKTAVVGKRVWGIECL